MKEWVIVMCAIYIIVIFAIIIVSTVAFGQDIDPRYYCLYKNQYPFSELCNDQEIDKIMDELLETAKRWNQIH